MQRATGVAKSTGQKVANAFKIGVAAIAGAATSAIILGNKIFDIGSSVLETRSKFETVFGAATASVDQFIAEFGQLAGLSKSQAEAVLSTTGAIVQGFGFAGQASADMSEQIARLGGDLASFNNLAGGTAEGIDIINRTLTGEFERAKSVGVVIRALEVDQRALANTGKETAKALTEQERVTARLQLFTERAGVAVGDLARTQDSAANRARQLGARIQSIKETLSVAFLPVISNNVLPLLVQMAEWVENNTTKVVRLGTAFIEVGKVLVTTARDIFQIVGGVLGDLGALLVGIFTFDFNLIKTAVIDLKDVMIENVQEIFSAWSGLAENLPQVMDEAAASVQAGIGKTVQQQTQAVQDFNFEIKDIPRSFEEVKLSAIEIGPKLDENLTQPVMEANQQSSQFVSSLYDTAVAAGNVVDAMKNIVKQLAAAIVKAAALKAITSAFGFGGGGGFLGGLIGGIFQEGGVVPGRGPVPIVAHGGEAVLTREAVQRFGGPHVVERINAGDAAPTTTIERVELSFPGVSDVASLRRELPGIIYDLRRKGRL
jgi:hypothetical protein